MFGSLKKKLRDAIDKISGKIEKEDHVILEEKDFKQEPIAEETLNIEEKEAHSIEELKEPDVLIENEEEWQKQVKESDKKIVEEIDNKIEKLEDIEKNLEEEIEEKEDKDVVKQDKIIIEEIEYQKERLEKIREETLKEEQLIKEPKQDEILEEIAETLAEKIEVESKQQEKEEKILGKADQPLIEKALEDLNAEKKAEEDIKETVIEEIKLDDILKAEEEHKKTIEEKTKEIIEEQTKKIMFEETLPEIKIDSNELSESERLEPEIIVEKVKYEEPKEEKKFSLFKKISEKTLSEEEIQEVLDNIKTVLLENDVALEVTEKICIDVNHELTGKTIKRGKTTEVIESALRDAMFDVLNQEKIDIEELIENKTKKMHEMHQAPEPLLVMVLGFNGVGKTTTVARLAHKYKKYNPVIAAGDTFRAASIEQLEEHGKNLKVDIVKHRYGADSAAVIFDAKKHAEAKGSKLVLGDTAGRAHTNTNLMDELKKVCRVNKPDLKILVLDALTGNDIYEQARLFDQAVGVDAIILTKTDVYEKGGAALSAAYTIKKPILFLGSGQNYGDLKEFKAEDVVKSLLG